MQVVSALLSVDEKSDPYAYLLTEVSLVDGTVYTKECLMSEEVDAWNGKVENREFKPEGCSYEDVPVVHRQGATFVKHKGKYAWCLGELEGGRIRLLSVYGKVADVDYATAFNLALSEGVCNLAISNNYKLSGLGLILPLHTEHIEYRQLGAFARVPKVGDIAAKDSFDFFGDPIVRAGDVLTELQVRRLKYFGVLPPILDSSGLSEKSIKRLATTISRFYVDLGEATWLLHALVSRQDITLDMLRKGIPIIPLGGLPWVIRYAGLDTSVACHSVTVSQLVGCLASEVLETSDPEIVERAMLSGLLHDVGKLDIDPNILEAGRKLSSDEFDEIKKHPQRGYDILIASSEVEVRRTAYTALRHHVKKHGKGYPEGIEHDELSPVDYLVQFCDIFSALLVQRQYKAAYPPMQALRMTCDELMAGGSPEITERCVRAIQKGFIGALVQMADGTYGTIESIDDQYPVGAVTIRTQDTGELVVGDGTKHTEPIRILGK